MKPKTKIQKEVARLSANLRPISATQIDWAYRHCVEHIGYRTKKGNITCSDCGLSGTATADYATPLKAAPAPNAMPNSKCRTHADASTRKRRISA